MKYIKLYEGFKNTDTMFTQLEINEIEDYFKFLNFAS